MVPASTSPWAPRSTEGLLLGVSPTGTRSVHYGDPRFGPYIPPAEGPIYLPDLTSEQWRPLDQTRKWDDVPDGAGLYRLHCSQRDAQPTRVFTTRD
jgi:hypothetical protein